MDLYRTKGDAVQTNRAFVRSLALVFSLAAVGAAHAVQPLQGRDINGNPVAANAAAAVMEFDPNLNITWLRDWDKNGVMEWNTAKTWASTLTVGAFSGWSLPSALNQDGTGPCVGYSCSSSQLGYMFYTELGNPAGGPPSNSGPFQNVKPVDYWSGTEYAPVPGFAWRFGFYYGNQGYEVGGSVLPAVAVRAGDVAAAVPEAQTWTLMMAGLGAVAVALRRRQV
jgi:hypothetical protein